jgi:hypothetical protein
MSLAVVVNAAAFVASSPYHVTPDGVSNDRTRHVHRQRRRVNRRPLRHRHVLEPHAQHSSSPLVTDIAAVNDIAVPF